MSDWSPEITGKSTATSRFIPRLRWLLGHALRQKSILHPHANRRIITYRDIRMQIEFALIHVKYRLYDKSGLSAPPIRLTYGHGIRRHLRDMGFQYIGNQHVENHHLYKGLINKELTNKGLNDKGRLPPASFPMVKSPNGSGIISVSIGPLSEHPFLRLFRSHT